MLKTIAILLLTLSTLLLIGTAQTSEIQSNYRSPAITEGFVLN